MDEDEQQELPPQFRNKYPRRPPVLDSLLNNVRAITKKVEHIKGFKFEMAGGLSNNFHITTGWTIPNTQGANKQGPMMGGPMGG